MQSHTQRGISSPLEALRISPVVLSALKGLLSPDTLSRLTPLGGFEARVYTDGERVYKVYRPGEAHLAALEAERMARAGLGSFVLGVAQVEGQGVLVSAIFPENPSAPKPSPPRPSPPSPTSSSPSTASPSRGMWSGKSCRRG